MRILLLGSRGQLGQQLQNALTQLGEVFPASHHALHKNEVIADLSQPESLYKAIKETKPAWVVNAAAFTAVDEAEKNSPQAFSVNASGPGYLAELCAQQKIGLVHYSTDYVFSGAGEKPWQETDKPAPLNIYGKSKLAGEDLIKQSSCQHLIFRTSWVFSARGKNFLKTILHLAQNRENLSVVKDQIGVPTHVGFLADMTIHAMKAISTAPALQGTYHLAPVGETNWFEYAKLIVNTAQEENYPLKLQEIIPQLSDSYPTPAKRPLNSRLNCQKFDEKFHVARPDWQQAVCETVRELKHFP